MMAPMHHPAMETRDARPAGAGLQDDLQHPRAADQPRGRQTPADRRLRDRPDLSGWPRRCRTSGPRPLGSSMAATGQTRSRSRAPRRWPNSGTGASAGARCTPEDAGLPVHDFRDILGGTPARNAAALRALLEGETGAYRDAVLLNGRRRAGGGGSRVTPLRDGVEIAVESIDSGRGETRRRDAGAHHVGGELKGEGDGDDPRQDQGIQARRDRGGQGRATARRRGGRRARRDPAFGPSRRPS